jgi:GH43 family beta-xylosidase
VTLTSAYRKLAPATLVGAALAFSHGTAPAAADVTPTSYANPVTWPAMADPGVVYFRGEYYLYPTAGLQPVGVARSEDLVSWEWAGDVLEHGTAGGWDARDIWAPEVLYHNGTFYLYYTGTSDGTDKTRRVGYATSKGPLGPFRSRGPLLPAFTIDPHPFRDPASGRLYLYYNGPTTRNNVDEFVTPGGLAGSPEVVTEVTESREEFWNEAAWTVERDGAYYNFFSAGCFCSAAYSVNYATSTAPKGAPWTKGRDNPLLGSTERVDGPGHPSIVKGPGQVEDWAVYHGREAGAPVDARSSRVDRLYWNAGRPYFMPPTRQEAARPDPGTFRDLFNRADGQPPGKAWSTAGDGRWLLKGRALSQRLVTPAPAIALPTAAPASEYAFDVFLRVTSRRGGARVGVVAWYQDDVNVLYGWLDRATNSLVISGTLGGKPVESRSAALPADTNLKAWHQLRVIKNESHFTFSFDGVRVASVSVQAGPGVPGLATHGARGEFDGVAYSVWFEDAFRTLPTTWGDAPNQSRSGQWRASNGVLSQTSRARGVSQTFKGTASIDLEIGADVRASRAGATGSSRYGVMAYADEANYFRALLDPAGPALVVDAVTAGFAQPTEVVPLPAGFEPGDFNHLRVTKYGSRFEVYVNNRPTASRSVDIGAAIAGLVTEDAAADFDNAFVKWINTPQNLVLNSSFENPQSAATNPWEASGEATARAEGGYYWSASGLVDGGSLRQRVAGLRPSTAYVLSAWGLPPEQGAATLSAGGEQVRLEGAGGWRRLELVFRTDENGSPVDVVFASSAGEARIDDVFLRESGVAIFGK